MGNSSQQRAIANFRNRLAEKGLVRFEVTGRDADRDLVSGEAPQKGGILKALLASPLIGSELNLTRPREEGRDLDI